MSVARPAADRQPAFRRPASIFLAVAAVAALANLAACTICFDVHRRAADDRILAPTAIVFLACLLAQARIVYLVWRGGRTAALAGAGRATIYQPRFWRRLALGMFVAYVTTLAVGPLPRAVWPWAAASSAWYTLLLLPLAAPPMVVDRWRRWSQLRAGRRLSWLVYTASLTLVASESLLQAYRLAAERQTWLRGEAALAERISDKTADIAGISSASRDPRRPFRIAVVADRSTLGSHGQAWLEGIKQTLPWVEIVPIALGADGGASRLATPGPKWPRSNPIWCWPPSRCVKT